MKPHVICHMVASLDGRIITSRWGKKPDTKAYETTAATFDSQAWLCGRVTMEKDFTDGLQPDLQPGTAPPDRHDFVADKAATSFAIAIDAHGKLGWESGQIDDDHLISVLTEQVSDEYLAYLRRVSVSYLFGVRKNWISRWYSTSWASFFPSRLFCLKAAATSMAPCCGPAWSMS